MDHLVLPRRCEWAACKFVIAGLRCVIAAPDQVRGFSTRNPVHAWHWIPDRVREDKQGVRDGKQGVREDKLGVREDKQGVREDKRRIWDDKGTVEISVSLSV
ncbi:MAG: hypothetical protein D4R79_07035 [Comamonadaceae bacterium]|nr:MAG: hypothetical protein D4R79_07035 [Comamonadaceae bacterium]